MVCSQSCSLIFILPTCLLISPEGCPFPSHSPKPIRNHKRVRKLRGEHLNILTSPGSFVVLSSPLYFHPSVRGEVGARHSKLPWWFIFNVFSKSWCCWRSFSFNCVRMNHSTDPLQHLTSPGHFNCILINENEVIHYCRVAHIHLHRILKPLL